MKLAFSTLACPDWTLEHAAAFGRDCGYEGIELRLLDGELLRGDVDQGTRRRIREACDRAGLPIVCLDTSVKIAQTNVEARAAQLGEGQAFLELAAELGTPQIRVFGSPPAGTLDDVAVAASIECMHALAEPASRLGIVVALETHDAFSSATMVASVLQHTPAPYVGALWDTLHPFRVGQSVPEVLDLLAGRLFHVHVKDGRRSPNHHSEWDLTLLGEGEVPMPLIVEALRESGYDGWLSVEWEKKWHPDLAEPEMALPQHATILREYLSNSLYSD